MRAIQANSCIRFLKKAKGSTEYLRITEGHPGSDLGFYGWWHQHNSKLGKPFYEFQWRLSYFFGGLF